MLNKIKHIIFYRNSRGIGDACMLKPTVDKWASSAPEAEITIIMDRPQSAVFEHENYTIIPVENFDITDFDNAVFFNVSHCCLDYERRRHVLKSRVEIFAEHCEVEIEPRSTIRVTDEEIQHIYSRMPILRRKSNGQKMLGIVLRSATEWRTYPHTILLMEYFAKSPIFDKKRTQITPIILDHEQVFEGFQCSNDLDIRETIALISLLDLVIGPDTGTMHIAGMLHIPTLWIFGPTDPNMRVSYYEKAIYIWEPCNPQKACWYDYCEKLDCLWDISPWEIARKARQILVV